METKVECEICGKKFPIYCMELSISMNVYGSENKDDWDTRYYCSYKCGLDAMEHFKACSEERREIEYSSPGDIATCLDDMHIK
jgi:hypothetical protein